MCFGQSLELSYPRAVPFLISPSLKRDLAFALDADLRSVQPVSGGDINDAFKVGLSDGRRLFVKAHRAAPPGMFQREAEGLAFLREGAGSGGLLIPQVIAQRENFLVLQLLEAGPRVDAEALGRGLAQLHRSGAPCFGLLEDNFIGTLPQRNSPMPSWAEFYGERRLLAQANLPGARQLLGRHERKRLERLITNLPQLLGPPEPPARLHGDLWGGNFLATKEGPALVDPAVYGGHREVDLAMMRLFGGFAPEVFEAYREEFPLAPGAAERVALYQLYPLLVHLNLFGSSYASQVSRVIADYT